MKSMSVETEIYLALAYRGTNVSALARAIGMRRQTLHRKISGNTLKKEELCKIGKALGAKYLSCFMFPGGVVFGDTIKSGKKKKTKEKPKVA